MRITRNLLILMLCGLTALLASCTADMVAEPAPTPQPVADAPLPKVLDANVPTPIDGNHGKYMNPYTKAGALAVWAQPAVATPDNGMDVGSEVGGVVGQQVANKVLDFIPFGLGGTIGEHVGKAAGSSNSGAPTALPTMDKVTTTSDTSFKSAADLAVYIYAKYAAQPDYAKVLAYTERIYPDLTQAYVPAIKKAAEPPASPVITEVAPATLSADIQSQLDALNMLKDKGLISAAEFQTKKEKLLGTPDAGDTQPAQSGLVATPLPNTATDGMPASAVAAPIASVPIMTNPVQTTLLESTPIATTPVSAVPVVINAVSIAPISTTPVSTEPLATSEPAPQNTGTPQPTAMAEPAQTIVASPALPVAPPPPETAMVRSLKSRLQQNEADEQALDNQLGQLKQSPTPDTDAINELQERITEQKNLIGAQQRIIQEMSAPATKVPVAVQPAANDGQAAPDAISASSK